MGSTGSAGVLPIQHVIDKIQKFDSTPVLRAFTVSNSIAPQPSVPRNENIETLHLGELDAFEVRRAWVRFRFWIWIRFRFWFWFWFSWEGWTGEVDKFFLSLFFE
jgi:hypothetical protein